MKSIFSSTSKGSWLSRAVLSMGAVTAMLLTLGIVPSALAAQDYPNGIKGEYNALDINAGVATQMYTLDTEAKREVVRKNFNQITPENSFKPEGWYDENHNFRMSEDTRALLKFASENNIKIYGHVLVWYSQTPDWFFQADQACVDTNPNEGATSCAIADKATMQERQRAHIENVAKAISDEFGKFGSSTNPVVAFDVVNETVNDGPNEATRGMRNSLWYQTYGSEEYIYDAFKNASEYLNKKYAATDHPVKLFINDYNTEIAGKRSRYVALLQRMVDNNVPFDGVGHQFHVTLSTPVSNLEDAIKDIEPFGKFQAISEFDVTTGTPVTEGKLINQGQYFYQLNQIIHRHAKDFFSVTVWGLRDDDSWRAKDGAPLLFDKDLNQKPSYVGWIGDKANLPEPLKTMNAFKDTSVDEATSLEATKGEANASTSSTAWERVPSTALVASADNAVSGDFKLFWKNGAITARVDVKDSTKSANDSATIRVGNTEYVVNRDGAVNNADAKAKVSERADGYTVAVSVPVAAAEEKAVIDMNVIAKDGATGSVSAWSSNATGAVTLVEALSYAEAQQVKQAPTVDADASDEAWKDVPALEVAKVTGATPAPEATATAKTVWAGTKLYVLMQVKDADIDLTNSNPWEKDSVEIYVDRGNTKSIQYTKDIQQIRVSADGKEVTFGNGADEETQKSLVQEAAKTVDGGYVVELAIELGANTQAGDFVGADFQINDAKNGSRIGIRNWADPTGTGYQTAAHWGVVRLVAPKADAEENPAPAPAPAPGAQGEQDGQSQAIEVTLSATDNVAPGDTIDVTVRGAQPNTEYELWLYSTPIRLASVRANAAGVINATLRIPANAEIGNHHIVLTARGGGATLAQAALRIGTRSGAANGASTAVQTANRVRGLARTGSEVAGLIAVVFVMIISGIVLTVRRIR